MIVMPWARQGRANGKTHGTQSVPWLPVAIFRGEVNSPLHRQFSQPSTLNFRPSFLPPPSESRGLAPNANLRQPALLASDS
jgi:hypothetical protein